MPFDRRKIVVTRPLDQAEQFVSLFSASVSAPECDVEDAFFIEPLLSIGPIVDDRFQVLDPKDYDGVLLTSANALHEGLLKADFSGWQDRKLFVVGEQTAIRAREAGFHHVQVFADVSALRHWFEGQHIKQNIKEKNKILYLRGEVISADIASDLGPYGYDVDELITYRALPNVSFSSEFLAMVKSGQIGGISFFSKRTAMIFMSLASGNGVLKSLRHVPVYCISDHVASYVRESFIGDVWVSSSPDRRGMMELIKIRFLD